MRTKFAASALVFSCLACSLVAVANGDSISNPAIPSLTSAIELVASAEEDALACTFDRAEFAWHLKVEAQGQSLGSLIQLFSADDSFVQVTEEVSGTVTTHPPSTLVHAPLSPADAQDARRADGGGLALACASTDVDCAPRMVAVAGFGLFAATSEADFLSLVTNQEGSKHTLVISFAEPTSAPPLLRKEDVDRYFRFSAPVGEDYVGVWRNPSELSIEVLSLPEEPRFSSLGLGNLQLYLRVHDLFNRFEESLHLRGTIGVRFPRAGSYSLQHCLGPETAQRLGSSTSCSEKVMYHVGGCTNPSSCGEFVLEDEQHREHTPTPLLSMDGTIAFDGTETFEVPDSALLGKDEGSWSISFWIFPREGPNGKHRTLFYKGKAGGHRTPSAWFLPDSNRITMRISSEKSMDEGESSVSEIPTVQWSHLTFTFANVTASENTAAGFRYTLYIDGRKDVSALFSGPALRNEGPLYFARDPWNSLGKFRGYVFGLRIFGTILSAKAAHFLFLSAQRPPSGLARLAQTTFLLPLVTGSSDADEEIATETVNLDRRLASLRVQLSACAEMHSGLAEVLALQDATRVTALAGEAQCTLSASSSDAKYLSLCNFTNLANTRSTDILGLAYLGMLDTQEQGCPDFETPNLQSASQSLASAAADGHGGAMRLLGQLVGSGLVESDEARQALLSGGDGEGKELIEEESRQSSIATTLYHGAALRGDTRAKLALADRYLDGRGVLADVETTAFYFHAVAKAAQKEQHAGGHESIQEMERLSPFTNDEDQVVSGNLGNEDDVIALQLQQAEGGDVASMLSMGDLYYYGARGLPRDQARAYSYFERAARHGDPVGMTACGNMLLKGEGTERNKTKAVEMYEAAAEKDNLQALNGLGVLYFQGGDFLEKNVTRAFELFSRATGQGAGTGDSFFNLGHCYLEGHGTEKDPEAAFAMFKIAAQKGNFDATLACGSMSLAGRGILRSPATSLQYLYPAGQYGSWNRDVRSAFEAFLREDLEQAALRYVLASELGYEVAHNNAAYLFDRGLVDVGLREEAGEVRGKQSNQGNVYRRIAQERVARRHYIAALKKLRKQDDFAFAVGSRPAASAGGAGRGSPAGQIALRLGDYEYFSLGQGRRLPCHANIGPSKKMEKKEMSEIISSIRLGALVREESQRHRAKRLYNAAKLYLFASAEGSSQASFTLGTMFERGELDVGEELGVARSTLTRRASLARAESFYRLARSQSAATPEPNSAAVFAADTGLFILSLRQRWWWHAYGLEEFILGTPVLRALLPDAPMIGVASDGVDTNGRVCGQEEIPMNVRVLAGAMTMDGEKAVGRYIRMWSRAWMWCVVLAGVVYETISNAALFATLHSTGTFGIRFPRNFVVSSLGLVLRKFVKISSRRLSAPASYHHHSRTATTQQPTAVQLTILTSFVLVITSILTIRFAIIIGRSVSQIGGPIIGVIFELGFAFTFVGLLVYVVFTAIASFAKN